MLGFVLLVRGLKAVDEQTEIEGHGHLPRWPWAFVCAGAALGLAMVAVPVGLREASTLSVVVSIWLFIRLRKRSLLPIACLGAPQVVLVAIVYLPRLPLGERGFFLGAQNLATSLKTLQGLIFYPHQGTLISEGYPMLWAPLHAYDDVRPQWFVEGLMNAPGRVLMIMAMLLVCMALWRCRRAGPAVILPLIMPFLIAIHIAAEHWIFGLPLPFMRLGIQLLFWGLVATAVAIAHLAAAHNWHRYVGRAALMLAALFLVNNLVAWSPRHYFELPDNGLVPDILQRIEADSGGQPVSIGHPWYMGECFRYYRDAAGKDWLRLVEPERAHDSGFDYVVLNLSHMDGRRYHRYVEVARYPEFHIFLLRRADLRQSKSDE